jgi:hypothetical protein
MMLRKDPTYAGHGGTCLQSWEEEVGGSRLEAGLCKAQNLSEKQTKSERTGE